MKVINNKSEMMRWQVYNLILSAFNGNVILCNKKQNTWFYMNVSSAVYFAAKTKQYFVEHLASKLAFARWLIIPSGQIFFIAYSISSFHQTELG